MQAEEILVLLHGLWMSGPESKILKWRLEKEHGFRTAQFSYASVGASPAENAARLNEFLETLSADKVHLVGHSLGGLVIVRWLKTYSPKRPGRFVCIGAPLVGSAAARGLAGTPFGPWAMGKSLTDELLEGDNCDWTCEYELGSIAGTRPFGMGRLFGDLDYPHDGTVSVSETRLPGATDHICLPVTHTGMLFSPEVAEQVAHFLRHGRFQHA